MVVGSNSTRVGGTRTEIHTWRLLGDVAVSEGFKERETIPMDRIASRDPFSKNSGLGERIVWLVKP